MNTTAKGDKLENKLYSILKQQIEHDDFLSHKKSHLTLHLKKAYFSQKRKDYIVFDVAIEVSDPKRKNETPSITYLFECKNYSQKVEIGDVEKFVYTVESVKYDTGAVKPVFVTTVGVSDNTLNVLKEEGCGYILLSDNQEGIDLNWVLQRSSFLYSSEDEYKKDIFNTLETGRVPKQYQACCFGENYIGFSLTEFLRDMLGNKKYKKRHQLKPKIKYYSEQDLEQIAENIRQDNPNLGQLFLQDLIDVEREKTGLSVELLPYHESGIMGTMDFNKNEIKIYQQEYRYRNVFTLAHELAHYYLQHGYFLEKEYVSQNHFDVNIQSKELKILEYQANMLAGYLLMPTDKFLADVLCLLGKLDIKNRGFGYLYIDEQSCNISNFMTVTQELQSIYDVSIEALKIRLQRLGMLTISENSVKKV